MPVFSLPHFLLDPISQAGGIALPFLNERFEGTAELAGNHGQAFHLALNGVSSEVAFIAFGLEIFV